jgi:hypothetical protein
MHKGLSAKTTLWTSGFRFFIEFNGIPIIAASPLIAKWLFVNNDKNAPDEHAFSQNWRSI